MSELILFILVGGFIGYITNHLAIKMLFKPHRKYYFLKIPIPFTPGIIPKQKNKLAKKIAESFDNHLFSSKDLEALLLNINLEEIVKKKIDELLESLGPFAAMLDNLKPKVITKIISAIQEVIAEVSHKEIALKNIVEKKISALDTKELEKIILKIAKQEFRYISYFGAFLGALICLLQFLVYRY